MTNIQNGGVKNNRKEIIINKCNIQCYWRKAVTNYMYDRYERV
jgi:hypothetical protein